jgi:3-phosphoshikimate 1-carboxyvinyltransferase
LEALRTVGARIDASPAGGLPLTVHGVGRVAGGEVTIDASASSQLVSGLLLAAPDFDTGIVVRHVGPPVPSAPHLRMTVQMLRAAGAGIDDATPDVWAVEPGRLSGRGWDIEPDLSGAAPFLAAALVTGGRVTIPGWPVGTTQPGDQLRALLTAMGGRCTLDTTGLIVEGTGRIHGLHANLSAASELTMVLAALAALADGPSRFTGIAHVRGHETDRLAALTRELTALGAEVTELPDGLAIKPGPLRGGPFQTYDDHRMAHAGALLGLAVPGVRLTDVACTSKTLPDFPQLWTAMVGRGAPGTQPEPGFGGGEHGRGAPGTQPEPGFGGGEHGRGGRR